jgi:hypothetical protein
MKNKHKSYDFTSSTPAASAELVAALDEAGDFASGLVVGIVEDISLLSIGIFNNALSSLMADTEMDVPSTQSLQLFLFIN